MMDKGQYGSSASHSALTQGVEPIDTSIKTSLFNKDSYISRIPHLSTTVHITKHYVPPNPDKQKY